MKSIFSYATALLVGGLIFCIAVTTTRADEIRVLSGGAPQVALRVLSADFEKETGHRVTFTFGLVTAIQQRLAVGEQADLILLPMPLLVVAEKTTPLRAEGRGTLARVGIAAIVTDGAVAQDISSEDSVRKLLSGARKVALPEPSTPSGAHMEKVLEQLGIAESIKPKSIIRAAIDGGGELVAKGEADLGFYLLSEVQSIKGIAVVGLLPAKLQSFVVYGTAIPVSNATPTAALELVKYISHSARGDQWKGAGFELLGAK
jgi:molybdate transport system substrate-binding protein